MHPLDHVLVKLRLEVQAEQAQVEATTNLALNQGKPWCINPCSLSFILNIFFTSHYICALSV
jgi:hypothetical protein